MTNTQSMLQKTTAIGLAVALLLTSTAVALAATENAVTAENFVQGMQKDGDPVSPARSDATDALGTADGDFVSLGYGGEIWLGFTHNMSGGLMLAVQELTGGTYPLETADVYVSTESAGPWTFVGQATNEEGTGDGVTELSVEECFQYVRIVDTTDNSLHNNNSDGFDVDAVEATYDETCPEPEEKPGHLKAKISNKNGAIVLNSTVVVANTGGNRAGGSNAGEGGNGGDIENEDGQQRVRNSNTGNGGRGGDATTGGYVETGRANATANVGNTVNSNHTTVDTCGCNDDLHLHVRNRNFAFVGNETGVLANSGLNQAGGSNAGEGGNGGDIENEGDNKKKKGTRDRRGRNGQSVGGSSTGNGGVGGNSGLGGEVLTGSATGRATVDNTVNTNRTRVR